jgi:ABC-type transport system involved in multi-copper enzyme maturation permease subunit
VSAPAILTGRPTTVSERSFVPGMLWVTWRQHRLALVATLVLFAGLVVALVAQGIGMHATYAQLGLGGARSFDSARLSSLAITFENEYLALGMYVPRVAMFLPLVVGALVGAPLLAREFEAGTFRFVWTQGIGRSRWIVTKLLAIGLVLTAIAFSFSLAFAWWYRPFEHLMGPMTEVTGLVFAARMLLAFTIGALLGRLLRRTVPAIALTMVAWLAVVLPTALLLRPHIEAPLVARVDLKSKFSTEWTLSQWWVDPAGHRLGRAAYNTIARLHAADTTSWLVGHHYVQWETFQPASRFWTFQLVEASGLWLLAVALAGLTVWLVRRRAE